MDFTVQLASWEANNTALRHVRYLVFVEEQKVPLALEIDGLDPDCVHVIALDPEGETIGTGRMDASDKIGRMAVLPEARRRGVGGALLARLVQVAQDRGDAQVVLSAQVDAIPFYERFEFEAHGEVYDDAGIPHRDMVRDLAGD